MKSRSSASIGSGSDTLEALPSSRCHQWSRPSFIVANASSPSPPGRRRTTMQCSIDGASAIAWSASRLSGTTWPRR